MKLYLLILSALFVNLVFVNSAFANQIVTLQDGEKVLLKDDFTWQYVTEKQKINTASGNTASVVAVPIANNVRSTTIVLDNEKPSLQISQSGVDVVLGASQYKDGELLIPTALTNQGTQSVILVSLKLGVYSPNGDLLKEKTVDVWKSIKRMADTYLRPKTYAEGASIRLTIDKYSEYQIKVKVVTVLTR